MRVVLLLVVLGVALAGDCGPAPCGGPRGNPYGECSAYGPMMWYPPVWQPYPYGGMCAPPCPPKLIDEECEAEDMVKCARDREMSRRAMEKAMCDDEAEQARCAEREAMQAKKANAEMANKRRIAKKASKQRCLDEVMIHKLNDRTDVAEECENEGYMKSRADVLNKQREACKAAERRAAKAKRAREAAECCDEDEKAMRAARRAARKRAGYDEPCYAPCYDC